MISPIGTRHDYDAYRALYIDITLLAMQDYKAYHPDRLPDKIRKIMKNKKCTYEKAVDFLRPRDHDFYTAKAHLSDDTTWEILGIDISGAEIIKILDSLSYEEFCDRLLNVDSTVLVATNTKTKEKRYFYNIDNLADALGMDPRLARRVLNGSQKTTKGYTIFRIKKSSCKGANIEDGQSKCDDDKLPKLARCDCSTGII